MYRLNMIILALIFILITSTLWSDTLSPRDLRLLPEPRFSTVLFGDYKPDQEATIAHYNKVFEGKSAAEIVWFLEDNGYYVFFDSATEIGFYIDKRLIFFEYSARVELEFENGIFKDSNLIGGGVR